jgi:hypothetical protein
VSEETKRALLSQAANQFGVSPLAKKLKVSDGLVAAWLSGHAAMPDSALVDLAALLEQLNGQLES